MQMCTICSSNVIVKNELRKYKIKKEELLRNKIKSDKTNTKWWGKQSDYKWEIGALVTGGTAVLPNIIRKLFKKETSEAGVSQETLQMFLRTPAWISDEKKKWMRGYVGCSTGKQSLKHCPRFLSLSLTKIPLRRLPAEAEQVVRSSMKSSSCCTHFTQSRRRGCF